MCKRIFLLLLALSSLKAQSPNTTLTQRGGNHNAIFLNPAKLSSLSKDNQIHATFADFSLLLDDKSYDFLKELRNISSSENKNQEISQLLNENIGNILSVSANNFSSIYQNREQFSWSLGIANTLDAYFIPHSGFGSKGAMESAMEKYRIILGTVALQHENFHYGLNLKSIKKTQKNYNYSINDMLNNNSLKDYFNNEYAKSETTTALDAGILYEGFQHSLNPTLSLSVLDIGNDLTQTVGKVPTTTNIGGSLEPYQQATLNIDYLDIFKNQANSTFEDSLRIHLSHAFFNEQLKLNTGLLYNALLYGIEYDYSLFSISLHSYKLKDYIGNKERKYELSLALKW
ncbi:MAG: Unknown protein [uncultured Sulfurovum sp.]|uniref:Uncharacterized protein n=1 Tax=uncultured Sulfurovum sp. TaxID=269237 RepID=A0A6S6SM31_9BACT|nr:MAG: Unknown protein [uncultured Sulfurovum sp.]